MESACLSLLVLADMLAAIFNGTYIADPFLILFTNDVVPNPGTVLADLTEPTSSWYTRAVPVFSDPYKNPDGSVTAENPSYQFNYTGTDPSVIIYGYGVIDATGTDRLIYARRLDTPKTMSGTLDSLIITGKLRVPSIPQS